MNRLDQPVTLVLVDDVDEPASEPVAGWIRYVGASGDQLNYHFESPFPLVATRSLMSGKVKGTHPRGAVMAYVDGVLFAWCNMPRLLDAGDSWDLGVKA
jgi:hypothetical protein